MISGHSGLDMVLAHGYVPANMGSRAPSLFHVAAGAILTGSIGLSTAACDDVYFKEIAEPYKLADGTEIPVDVLNRGQEQYVLYCRPCHGVTGDGRGPAGIGLRPPPRDFRDPVFKFGGVEAGSLPPDSELMRIVQDGLDGTAMLPWDIPEPILEDIIQYIKVFSPIWAEEEPEALIEMGEDPWASKPAEGIARGKQVYHGLAQCLQCHPAYATKQEVYEASKALTGNPIRSFRPSMYQPLAKLSSAFKHKLLPPDFGRHPIKAGSTPKALFRTIAAGIGGTAMPMWKDSIPDDDIWAISHFVASIADMKDKPAYTKMMAAYANAPAWEPPPEPANAEGEGEESEDDEDDDDEEATE